MSESSSANPTGNDVIVVGDSPTAFASALDFAELGLTVALFLPPSAWVSRGWPVGPVADSQGHVSAFIERFAQSTQQPEQRDPRLAVQRTSAPTLGLPTEDGAWGVLPEPHVLGIPAVPLHELVTALVGGSGATRGYLDRLLPVLRVGKATSLDRLVRARLGSRIADRLVAPVVAARFGCSLAEAEVPVVAPGLNEAVTRAGSLSGGVLALAERWNAHEQRVMPASGWATLREAALQKLQAYRVQVMEDTLPDAAWLGSDTHDPEATQAGPGIWTVRAPSADARSDIETLSAGLTESEAACADFAPATARVVVVDLPDPAAMAFPAAREILPQLQQLPVRDTATVPAHILPESALHHAVRRSPVGGDASGAFTGIVAHAAGVPEGSTVLIHTTAGSEATLELRLPVTSAVETRSPRDATRSNGLAPSPEMQRAQAAAVAAARELGVTVAATESWHAHRSAVPAATESARAVQELVRAQVHAGASSRVVQGALIHGGSLDTALGEARARTVPLRRHLSGI